MLSSLKQYILSHRPLLLVILCCLLVGMGALAYHDILPVSYTVGNRELPIYSVDTTEKKIALSFDAAWGGGNLR